MNWQRFKDIAFFPVRAMFDHRQVSAWGLTSFQDERINACLPYCRGKALDIGCGAGNRFIRRYGNGLGLDLFQEEGVDVVADCACLPFPVESFGTVLFIGSFNYVVEGDRDVVMREAYRVLAPGGVILITMISPAIKWLRRKTAWWDRRVGEVEGAGDRAIKSSEIREILRRSNFKNIRIVPFNCHLNKLIIAEKTIASAED